MPDREKVIKGLECCRNLSIVDVWKCPEECPYSIESAPFRCCTFNPLLDDAMELLKGNGARVLTLDEAEEADICWLEVKGVDRIVPCRISFSDDETVLVYRLMSPTETFATEDYGKRCRLWSAKPDGEQRDKVKWDE